VHVIRQDRAAEHSNAQALTYDPDRRSDILSSGAVDAPNPIPGMPGDMRIQLVRRMPGHAMYLTPGVSPGQAKRRATVPNDADMPPNLRLTPPEPGPILARGSQVPPSRSHPIAMRNA